MKLFRFQRQGREHLGVERDGSIVDCGAFGHGAPPSMMAIVGSWAQYRLQLASQVQLAATGVVEIAPPDWLVPLARPSKIVCIGRNYSEHAAEMGATPSELPIVFSKFASALCAHEATIQLPAISNQVDCEAELVVIIGRRGRNIDRRQARDYVFGYTCGNDVSARDWQKGRPGGQWLLGKSFDTFAPVGPAIVTADDVAWPPRLEIQSRVDGRVLQHANTGDMIFPIDFLIAHLSQFFTWQPGDMVWTGTPAGVGSARTPPEFLQPGNVVEVEIESIGTLRNTVA